MQFTLTINADSAAFDEGNRAHEIARILREVAGKVEDSGDDFNGMIHDFNGNSCGDFKSIYGES